MAEKNAVRGVIFDFNRTLYDPDQKGLCQDAMEVLDKLRESGRGICLVGKKGESDREGIMAELGIGKYFDFVLFVDGDKRDEHFVACLEAMRLRPGEVVVVGDRVKKEIALGKKLGMKTVWYKAGKFKGELPEDEAQTPDITITRLAELLRHV